MMQNRLLNSLQISHPVQAMMQNRLLNSLQISHPVPVTAHYHEHWKPSKTSIQHGKLALSGRIASPLVGKVRTLRSTSCARWLGQTHRTRPWRSTSAGRCSERREWSLQSRQNTCAQEEQQP